MNPFARLGPLAYSLLHSHNMLWELALARRQRRAARDDLQRLRARLPFIDDYERRASALRPELRAAYAAYTSRVSPASISISFPLATFLAVVCEARKPAAILDLGSGFSSYVFRAYAKRAKDEPVVYSVDLSDAWLGETRRFLQAYDLNAERLFTLHDFHSADRPAFDLILQDIADLPTRRSLQDLVVGACSPGGLIVHDDMHVPSYRSAITQDFQRRGLECFSLRALTRRRLRYASLVIR